MRFLLLNQTFYPDVAATAQYLTEVALALAERGHSVTVITGQRAYDDPDKVFAKQEVWRGISIIRIGSTGFGKAAKWRRAVDFGSFMLLCSLRLLFARRADVILALTSPPLISFLGAFIAKLRGSAFCYWVMDFNPDEAIAAGWLRSGSLAARALEAISRFSMQHAAGIIALDRFMRDRIVAKGIANEKVKVIPPWSHDGEVRFDPAGREAFRKEHGWTGKYVVMYSGNHSPCHPLDTLIAAARDFAGDPDVLFCFVGGGSEYRRIQQLLAGLQGREYPNIRCLPYQPLNRLSASLSAADLHVVVMGEPFVGLVHPCKIYNVLSVGAPVLYIGPSVSHVTEVFDALPREYSRGAAQHGDPQAVVQEIKRIRRQNSRGRVAAEHRPAFSKEALMSELIQVLEQKPAG